MKAKSVPLASVAEIVRTGVDPRTVPSGTRYVGLEDISGDGQLDEVNSVEASQLASTKFAFNSDHVLFGKLRPYLRKVARPNFSGICSTDIVPIAPGPELDRNYLFYFLRTDDVIQRATSLASGANLPRISPRHLLEFNIPLPALKEQRRIAATLDQVDLLRRKRRHAIKTVEDLREILFRSAFVEAHDSDWPLVEVGSLSQNIRTGPFGSQLLHSEFVDAGVAVLGIDNAVQNEFVWGDRRYITQEKYQGLRRYTVLPGDLIITIMGTCGRCAIVPDDVPVAINTKHLCCITLNKLHATPSFIHSAILMHPDIRKQLGVQEKGAVMPGLNMGIIKSLKLRLPPLELQKAFDQRLEALLNLRKGQLLHLEQIETLFASLQHRAFSGELAGTDHRLLQTA